ncbi:MAG: Gx transporter family protein [Candidatus Cellulosilyticum pullistercoris]|uniref:Gx transporter family protein n=1 Tax=Candidatus Cellulosilyticum pullistercoris TaxID=2838521 RepID=A0A9E2KEX3_9FIRM|nr:Gx transporter family protein [Candidatus Cellulosilyticum pullistercoris]
MKQTKHLIYMSLLVAMALALHLVERNIPVPFMTPGAKLGLANLVTVIALYTLDKKSDVAKIIASRLVLSSIFGGSVSGLMYGSMGALLSFIIMIIIKEGLKEKVSMIGVSAAGAVFHNIGQLLVAALIVQNIGVMLYLPVLSLAGIVTGIFIGIAANYTVAHMYKLPFFKEAVVKEKRIE